MTKKVIIADDSKELRESLVATMRLICKQNGIDAEFDQALDGKDLVERVLRGNYDLVFTDNHMAQLNGLRAIKQIRELNPTVPIYMLSSSSEAGNAALESGANGYLGKVDPRFTPGIAKALRTYLK
ncbi:MAG TPA: response regulator transcription factor [Candidatus Nanoarchaeia archaeon]|nr:response regulator transcription factor [Candidatus Nanoarchaeia archaeon]